MFVSFRTVFVDERGEIQSDDWLMAAHYFKTTFLIDLLATVPFDTILSTNNSYRIYKEEMIEQGGMPWVDLLGLFKLG